MASTSLSQSSLLSIADDMVRLFQSIITILSDYYEASVSSRNGPPMSTGMSSLEVVELTCHDLHQMLAVLWPCEKQFVAVLGPTGCGKSTLLNLLLSMMCAYGTTYTQGIRTDSVRAVLRDSARLHARNTTSCATTDELQDENVSESSEVLPNQAHSSNEYVSKTMSASEQESLEGLLGICCAQNKPLYMSKHISQYDAHPFILRNGRMGDAGTTKVTSVEYGPKFVGHIRWMTRKKLRRKLRDLRHMLNDGDRMAVEKKCLLELKDFWHYLRQLVNLPPSAESPTEEQINSVIDDLGTKRRLLDKEERIETPAMRGCIVDRIYVRDSIKGKLQQQLGKLIEDLRIEVPVASFEGGISLLDVPGTNDPRVLHQRETRDAIDRTSLILLVLDKSVMDSPTQESLAESLLLEHMLMDETARCSLVVVGIAEKVTKKGQSPKDVLAGFDSKGNILRALKRIFLKIASKLCKSKRIQEEHARNRIEDLFTSSITLIPVLPFLCASLHLSHSNPELHDKFCEAEGKSCCPARMSKEELRERCMETNIPHLLEKVHSVRVPPAKGELSNFISSALDGLKLLTKPNLVDEDYVHFLEAERDQACSVSFEEVHLKSDQVVVDMQPLEDVLDQSACQCKLEPKDIDYICNMVGEDLQSQLQTGRFLLGPFILRGFCPEVIGQKANKLIYSVGKESKHFTNQAFEFLCSLRGDAARLQATFDKVISDSSLVRAVDVQNQLRNKWKLSLDRLWAKCFCGGIDGGLLGQVREALRKAYDGALKQLLKELRRRSKLKDFRETVRIVLESNVLGMHAANVAKVEVKKALGMFRGNLCESMNAEMQFLWKSWQADIVDLANSSRNALHMREQGERNRSIPSEMKAGNKRFSLFQQKLKAKEEELKALERRMNGCISQLPGGFEYGYSLLQFDSGADTVSSKEEWITVDEPRPGVQRSERCSIRTGYLEESSHCLDNQGGLNEPMQEGAGLEGGPKEGLHCPDVQMNREGVQLAVCGAAANHHSLLGVSATGSKVHSFLGKSSRKAQRLSEAESLQLQKRESSAKRFRK